MEIRAIDAVPLRRELDERFANAQKWISAREYCLVRIETADGAVGWDWSDSSDGARSTTSNSSVPSGRPLVTMSR